MNCTQKASITVLSTADFASEVWTNKQFLAAGLADSGHTIYYIESIGLREPTFSWTDFKRVLDKLRGRHRSPKRATQNAPGNLHIITPKVLPWHRFRAVRVINKRIIDRTVLSRIPKEERSILWSFSPLTYGLEDSFGHTVYHSVDLLHTIPGVPELLLLARERHVLALSSTVVASSTGVAKHLKELGRNDVILWENVASTELFSASGHERTPRAIFAGNLTETKIAVPLFEALINRGVPIAIAGPVGIDGTRLSVPAEAVLAHPLVSYLGNLSLQDLAIEVGRSQVGLIPYLRNEYTRGVFPMKVFEYLASGLSVVSTELESLIDAQIEGLEVVGDEDFADVVHAEIAAFSESAATGRTLAASAHSWTSRIHDASELVERLAANEDCVTSAGRTALPGESRG